MPDKIDSNNGGPSKDGERPVPVQKPNQALSQHQNRRPEAANDASGGDGPGKVGLVSDNAPGLVPPSGVNERDHGAADDKPMGGGTLNFDDDEIYSGRGNHARSGGTWDAKGGDSGKLGAPSAGLSDRNGPSDPDKPDPFKR